MDPVIWEDDPPELRSPVLVCAFAGWNDAASAATRGARGGRGVARLGGRGADRPGGVLRLPGQPADDPPGRGADPPDRLAGEHAADGRACPRPSATWSLLSGIEPNLRWRTFAEAIVDGRRAARGGDGDHARRPDRRRRAHPAGADHRPRLRSRPGRAARPQPLQLRGADRDRRRRPRRLPAARADLGEPLGGGPALRRRGAQPEGGAGAAAPPGGPDRDRRRGLRARGRDRALRGAGRPRRLRQPGDRGAGPQPRGGAGGASSSPGQDVPSADDIAQEFQRFLRQRGTDKN